MTSDRAKYISAIRAEPDLSAPRLDCADWFQAQGGESNLARAEFIRTQVERSRLYPDDPIQNKLQARELRLLKKHAAAWCQPHHVFRRVRFRRGFIEDVQIRPHYYQYHRRQMNALEPVRSVSLSYFNKAPLDTIRRIAACQELQDLETLRINSGDWSPSPTNGLANLLESPYLSRLKYLDIATLGLWAADRPYFEATPLLASLTKLKIPESYVAGCWFQEPTTTVEWAKLRSLVIDAHMNSPVAMSRLTEMPFWKELIELDVNLTGADGQVIDLLFDRLPGSLRVLRLRGDRTDDESFNWNLRRLAELPLCGLHLQNICLDPEALAVVFGKGSHCALQQLTLSNCDLREEHVRTIADSDRLQYLWSLDLSFNKRLSPGMAWVLMGSAALPRIRRLSLFESGLCSRGVAALATAKRWEHLRSLDLTGKDVSEKQLTTLIRSDVLHHITTLRYTDALRNKTHYSPFLVDRILKLPNLAHLRLDVMHLDPRARATLMEVEPSMWLTVETRDNLKNNINQHVLPPVDQEFRYAYQLNW